MIIFLKNISPSTQITDLIDFIKPVMQRSLFYRFLHIPGVIVDITILKLLDKKKNIINVSSIITIMPDDVASFIIKNLDRKVISGRRITVKEYHIRSDKNDPRKFRINIPQNIIDRRVMDRRQYQLVSL